MLRHCQPSFSILLRHATGHEDDMNIFDIRYLLISPRKRRYRRGIDARRRIYRHTAFRRARPFSAKRDAHYNYRRIYLSIPPHKVCLYRQRHLLFYFPAKCAPGIGKQGVTRLISYSLMPIANIIDGQLKTPCEVISRHYDNDFLSTIIELCRDRARLGRRHATIYTQ